MHRFGNFVGSTNSAPVSPEILESFEFNIIHVSALTVKLLVDLAFSQNPLNVVGVRPLDS